jgi:hypothetical protein
MLGGDKERVVAVVFADSRLPAGSTFRLSEPLVDPGNLNESGRPPVSASGIVGLE